MRAACKLGAEVREFAGTLVKVSIRLAFLLVIPQALCIIHSIFAAHTLQPRRHFSDFSDFTIVTCMQPGVTTDEIDKAVHKMIVENGAYPSPLTYGESYTSTSRDTPVLLLSLTFSWLHGYLHSQHLSNAQFMWQVDHVMQGGSQRVYAHLSTSASVMASQTAGNCKMVTS